MISSSSRLSSNIAIYRLEPVGTLSGDLGPCVLQRLPRFVRCLAHRKTQSGWKYKNRFGLFVINNRIAL